MGSEPWGPQSESRRCHWQAVSLAESWESYDNKAKCYRMLPICLSFFNLSGIFKTSEQNKQNDETLQRRQAIAPISYKIGRGALHNEAINFWSSLVQKNAAAVKCAVMFLFHLLKRNSCEMIIRLLSYECKKGGGERSEHAYDPT